MFGFHIVTGMQYKESDKKHLQSREHHHLFIRFGPKYFLLQSSNQLKTKAFTAWLSHSDWDKI